ncbi:LysR family transcriptional regulator [Pigmentiphaga soli]|uniref:LysR family transcriptional regulator n=1 Tax=Pigmentiphaga soli TaxID=1007095 RepID=A0ABP8H7E4_9BURK
MAQQIRALERELGEALVARAGRTVRPTPAGHRLLAAAAAVLREVSALKSAVRDKQLAGELRLGTINTALHTVLPTILGSFVQSHPNVTVFVHSSMSRQLYDAVRDNFVDLAVCLHPRFALSKELAWQQLREEPLVVLAPEALAGRDPHRLLREEPLLRYDRSLGGGHQAEQYLRSQQIVPRERFELSSLLAIAMMVDQGLGVSLVPDIASPLIAHLRLVKIALPGAPDPRRFGLLWPRASPRAALISAFLEAANDVVRAGPLAAEARRQQKAR